MTTRPNQIPPSTSLEDKRKMRQTIYSKLSIMFGTLFFVAIAAACTGRTVPSEPPAPEPTGGIEVIPTPVPNAKTDR